MTLRSRLTAAALILLAALAAVGALLIRTVERSELAQTDRELLSVAPVALGLAGHVLSNTTLTRPRGAADSPLSDAYVAIVTDGRRQKVARPAYLGSQAPALPSVTSASPPPKMHPVTVGSLH
jgi:hypothetical protein